MKIVTWNVNSIRQRLPRVCALLERHQPDVLCVQETKVQDASFPLLDFEALGYNCEIFGQGGLNGVALISKMPARDVVRGVPGDPIPDQARAISATFDGIRVVNVYVVNGKRIGAPEYDVKLRWLDALASWFHNSHDPSEPVLVAGDFNVTPDDRDVHDPEAWRGSIHASEPERARIAGLLDWGFVDLLRLRHEGPGPFTWWDYRAGAFHKGWGLRIDLAFGTKPVADRCSDISVDRNERKPSTGEGAPSDHAPVIVTLEAPAHPGKSPADEPSAGYYRPHDE